MSVHVAVGVIINANNEVLIAKRSADQHQGNKWEFPGGKVESNETSQQALYRELNEELGIHVEASEHFIDIHHHYEKKGEEKRVFLEVFLVKKWGGVPKGQEGQPLQWAKMHALNDFDFPAANVEIIDKLLAI